MTSRENIRPPSLRSGHDWLEEFIVELVLTVGEMPGARGQATRFVKVRVGSWR